MITETYAVETMPKRRPRTIKLKVVPIGNSRGVRLPKAILDKCAIKNMLVAEERADGLLLRGKRDARHDWEETFKAMAREGEDWSDLDAALADGLDWGAVDFPPLTKAQLRRMKPARDVTPTIVEAYRRTRRSTKR